MSMDIYRTVKEAMFFAEKYRHLTLAIFLGEENTNEAQERGILRDISFLRQMGINILIGHYVRNLDIRNWFDIQTLVKICAISDLNNIRKYISLGCIPIVYCEESPELSSYATMALLAANIGAQKVVFITRHDGLYDTTTGRLIPDMDLAGARSILSKENYVTLRMRDKIEAAILACERGIPRVHIINGSKTGSLIKEIFSSLGSGTMIHEKHYRLIREARHSEATNISDILRLSSPSFSVPPTEVLKKIHDWRVFLVDDQVQGCLMVDKHTDRAMEISYLTTSKPYETQQNFQRMLDYALSETTQNGFQRIFLEKAKTNIWLGLYPWLYKDFGFQRTKRGSCPDCSEERANSIVWAKNL